MNPKASGYEVGLLGVIGEVATIGLAEHFGGTRLLVPTVIPDDHDIINAIGIDAAKALAAHYSPDVIRVPVARELRAKHYRVQGLSNSKIAVRLGMTEPGVNKLFQRLKARAKA